MKKNISQYTHEFIEVYSSQLRQIGIEEEQISLLIGVLYSSVKEFVDNNKSVGQKFKCAGKYNKE